MCKGNIALNIYLCSKTANEECPQSHTWKETELRQNYLIALFSFSIEMIPVNNNKKKSF